MAYQYRDAVADDLPRIVEIYNFAVATRTCSCDLEPTTVEKRRASFEAHTPGHRPLWVAEDSQLPGQGAIGYLGFFHFMNERPGYFITADLAIYLHPRYQRRGLGRFLLEQAIARAPGLGIETLTATIFASNTASLQLFEAMGF
jgi:L-amino acid N-acyltransferase YncA